MTGVPLRLASTVVLLRDRPGQASGFEVFLVRRHDKVAFMGGAYVFPGGRVDPADAVSPDAPWHDGGQEAVRRFPDLPAEQAIAHHVAAVRELFEEAGVLLARSADGRAVQIEGAAAGRLAAGRSALQAGRATLSEIVRPEGLRLALDLLVPFAHWVTPEVEIKRFDTRFFVARVPAGQVPIHDRGETTHSEWMAPAEAVARCVRDEIVLPPPTWVTLKALARHDTVEAVLAWARRQAIVRVQPGFVKRDGFTMLTMPGDPLLPAVPGFEVPEETRFVLRNGSWKAVKVGDPEVPLRDRTAVRRPYFST